MVGSVDFFNSSTKSLAGFNFPLGSLLAAEEEFSLVYMSASNCVRELAKQLCLAFKKAVVSSIRFMCCACGAASGDSMHMKACACKQVYYCSLACQRLDWPQHKTMCLAAVPK